MNGIVKGVLIGSVGVGIFAASVVGMMAATGRLNPEGAKNVPILNKIYKEEEPEPADGTAKTGEGSAGDASFRQDGKAAKKEDAAKADKKPLIDEQERELNKRKLFKFDGFEANVAAEEIRRLQRKLAETLKKNELRKAALDKREMDLQLREQDLTSRRESVMRLMTKIDARLEELRALRVQFEKDVTVLKESEKKNIKRQAEQLGAMDPKKASEFILELGAEKEDLAVKLLVSMEVEAASQILSLLDAQRGAKLIERATRVLQTK